MTLFKAMIGVASVLIFVLAFSFAGSMAIIHVLEHMPK